MKYYLIAFSGNEEIVLMTKDSLKEIDYFTMQFGNDNDLNNFYNSLSQQIIKYNRISVFWKNDDKSKLATPLKVRYKEDKYYDDDIKLRYKQYLISDPDNIEFSSIRFMKSSLIEKYREEHSLSESEIRLLVDNYLTSYYKIREAYFEMKTTPNKSKIKFDDIPKNTDYESDDHNLQILLENGDIDEIMKTYSLEDLHSMLKDSNKKKPFVDGLMSIKKR